MFCFSNRASGEGILVTWIQDMAKTMLIMPEGLISPWQTQLIKCLGSRKEGPGYIYGTRR